MKLFRWILSHLTLIVFLSLLFYIYWNRSDIWPVHTSIDVSQSAAEIPAENTGLEKNNRVLTPFRGFDNEDLNTVKNELHDTGDTAEIEAKKSISDTLASQDKYSPSSVSLSISTNNFAERMNQYKKLLPVEEREVMEKADEIFHQVSDGPTEYQHDNVMDTGSEEIQEIEKAPVVQNEVFEMIANKEPTNEASIHSEVIRFPTIENLTLYQKKASSSPDNESELANELAARSLEESLVNSMAIVSKSDVAKPNVTRPQTRVLTKNMQQQIRRRQNQLQNQMVMMIPFNPVKKPATRKFKIVQPIINTSEQKILLNDARKAFDEQEFLLAEEKYQQLIKELPELPDAVGELANVYRTQNKTPEYLSASTQFVELLGNHFRFDEAWNVAKRTARVDAHVAEKQRSIIKQKQSELE